MSTHNICFCGEIKKIIIFGLKKSALSLSNELQRLVQLWLSEYLE